jgi:hypothetical protein
VSLLAEDKPLDPVPDVRLQLVHLGGELGGALDGARINALFGGNTLRGNSGTVPDFFRPPVLLLLAQVAGAEVVAAGAAGLVGLRRRPGLSGGAWSGVHCLLITRRRAFGSTFGN